MTLPSGIRDVTHLEDLLSEPSEAAVAAMGRLSGDVLVLGAGGKMGPSLTRMVRRASQAAGVERRVTAVSRFSQGGLEQSLREQGIDTLAGDLLDEQFVSQLPEAENLIVMTGAKFGTGDNPSATWAMNTYVPMLICRRFPGRRIAAFSTGNVYPFMPVDSGGAVETDAPAPVGEYGMSALGRERMFEYFCRREGSPTVLVRLNYAVEMRYGVLVDLAQTVHAGQPVDLSMGYANVIWQGDANAMTLAALADAAVPASVINVAGPERVEVRRTCERFGELLGKRVTFTGEAAQTALLSNGSEGHARYGRPRVSLDRLIEWTADWIKREAGVWNKATHFQTRDGRF